DGGQRDRRPPRGRGGGGGGQRGGRGGGGGRGGAASASGGPSPKQQPSKQSIKTRQEAPLRAPERRAAAQQQPRSEPIDRVGVSAALSREPQFPQYMSARSMAALERASGAV